VQKGDVPPDATQIFAIAALLPWMVVIALVSLI